MVSSQALAPSSTRQATLDSSTKQIPHTTYQIPVKLHVRAKRTG